MNWYYVLNGQQTGPITEAQLDDLARAGTIKADTLVWAEGMANWLPYSQARNTGSPGQPPVIAPMAGASQWTSVSTEEKARQMVQGPAIGLMVSGGIGVALALYGVVDHLVSGEKKKAEIEQAMSQIPPEMDWLRSIIEFMTGPFGLVIGVVALLVSVFMIFAGSRMKALRGHGMALTAAILGILSCCWGCCLVSLPIGIWAIVVLMKPEVKAAFK